MNQLLETRRKQFNQVLEQFLARFESSAPIAGRLHEALRYSMLSGGKRLRGMLVLECCVASGGDEAHAMPAAVAMELVHAFSLVHDDLPAMDNDDLRRGQPTTHRVFGEAEAILAGDWLLAAAFSALAMSDLPSDTRTRLVRTLSEATQAMIAGQSADLAGEQKPPDAVLVEYIHRNKTAALIEAACVMGAVCAAASEAMIASCQTFGRRLGLAFQITDDLLDATGTALELGKNVRKDAERQKQTYPAVFGVDRARHLADAQLAQARQAMAAFGHAQSRLECFVQMVEARAAQRTA